MGTGGVSQLRRGARERIACKGRRSRIGRRRGGEAVSRGCLCPGMAGTCNLVVLLRIRRWEWVQVRDQKLSPLALIAPKAADLGDGSASSTVQRTKYNP